jgi:hypothetical protein
MKIAIMQPYLFPYIGYFQLINAVDKFVIGDDYNFILQGWVNRNKILVTGKEFLFTVPLKKASPNKLIREIEISDNVLWQVNLLKTIEMAYSRAPYFKNIFPLIQKVINFKEPKISKLIIRSIREINKYLEVNTGIIETLQIYKNNHLRGQERVIDTCRQEAANEYINPIGGIKLYSKKKFELAGIELKFLKSETIEYRQFKNEFVPNLSLIDVLMFNSREEIRKFLNHYTLL